MNAPQLTHKIIVVTPEMARRWLVANLNNRKVRESRVLKYREDMESGRWTFAGDPVRFTAEGTLIDGQHRLLALSEAQVSGLPLMVIRGLPAEAQRVMDQGAKRSAGDQLAMLGVKNSSNVAAAIRQYLVWERGLLFRDSKAAHSEISTPLIEQWARENQARVDRLNSSMQHVRSCEARPMVSGAAFLIFEEVDSHEAAEFMRLLATGAGREGDPINTLDHKLRRQRRSGMKVTARDELALFIQAWNAWREGRTLSHLNRPKGGSWSLENFPRAR